MRKRLKVLHIEDVESDALFVRLELERYGFEPEVTVVDSREDFEAALSGEKAGWDVILSDHHMGPFDSLQALSIVKRLGRDIPFIIVAGAIDEEFAAHLMREGARDYILKDHIQRLGPALAREIDEVRERRDCQKTEADHCYQLSLMRAITTNATVGLFMLDADGRTTFMNPAAEVMTGYSFQELQGQVLHEAIHHSLPNGTPLAGSDCPFGITVLHGKNALKNHEDVFIRKDGLFFPVRCSSTPILDNGDIRQVVLEVQDLTAEKEAETQRKIYLKRLEQSNRELEQFAAIASHDLQEPLRKVRYFSEMLAEQAGPSGQDIAVRMTGALNRMQNLLDHLLMLSRVSRRGQPFRRVNLDELVRDVIEELQPLIRERDAEIVQDPLITLDADGHQLHEMLIRLLENALKQPGETPLRIHISGGSIENEMYEIRLTDNGPGFKPEDAALLFKPFLLPSAGQYDDTAIGFAICQKIIERHLGSIQVISNPDRGSTFIIRLPVRQP